MWCRTLKYPANTPSVGQPDTIGQRADLYFIMLAFSVVAMIAAAVHRIRTTLARAGWSWTAALWPVSGEATELDYVIEQTQAGWKVVDVLAAGSISRVGVQRSDFRRILSNGGGDALLASLQRKTSDLSGGVLV
jgi:hypothetical protein